MEAEGLRTLKGALSVAAGAAPPRSAGGGSPSQACATLPAGAGKNARELCPTGATLPAQAHLRRGFYMRALQILGATLILGGLFVLIKSPSYSSDKSVLKIGDVEAKVSQEHAIPPWLGGAGVVAGVILIVVGARKP
jgi:hypothetical protein